MTQEAIDLIGRAQAGTMGTALLQVLVAIWFIVAVLRWQAVAIGNQLPLGLDQPRFGAAKAAWCWFVPVWNLFGPKQAYNDLWRSGEPGAPATERPDQWQRRSVAPAVDHVVGRLGGVVAAGPADAGR